jgi:hypothetical protein
MGALRSGAVDGAHSKRPRCMVPAEVAVLEDT